MLRETKSGGGGLNGSQFKLKSKRFFPSFIKQVIVHSLVFFILAGALYVPQSPVNQISSLVIPKARADISLTNLVSNWNLNEASGDALDTHGSNPLTETGGIIDATTGKVSGARDFEAGDTEYFTTADNADLSTGDIDFSFAMWFQVESDISGALVSKNSGGGDFEYLLQYMANEDKLRLYLASGAGNANATSVQHDDFGMLSLGTWYFAVAWHDSVANTINIQINNGTVTSAAYTFGSWDSAHPFNMGNYLGEHFDGLIDEAAFWKRVLTPTERTQLYNSGSGLAYPFVTPPNTTLANGTNPSNSTIAPSSVITDLDSFLVSTDSGTDSVTALTVTLANGTYEGLSDIRITSDDGSTTYFSAVANPSANAVNFSGGTPIPVTTTPTQFKVRITPKTHANMAAVPGTSFTTTGTVTAFTSTNTQAGSDSGSATITVDNLSPANVTSSSGTAGDAQVALTWTNPVDSDFSNVLVLRNTSAVSDVPTEGSSPTVGATIGTSTARYILNGTSFTDTGLTNNTTYHYKIFTKDSNGNYSQTGVVPTGSPYIPVELGGTIDAASCNASDVQTALNAATIGSTINIPAGTCNWTTGVTWTAPADVTLRGAGSLTTLGGGDVTVIVDDYASGSALLNITAHSSGFRLAGLTIRGGSGLNKDAGIFQLNGPSANTRIDHVHFDMTTYSPLLSGAKPLWVNDGVYGVLDNSIFDLYANSAPYFFNGMGSDGQADASWAAPTNFGSADHYFLEDNLIRGTEVSPVRIGDSYNGSRVVWRFNTIQGGSGLEVHATGHAGDGRGARSQEGYGNHFTELVDILSPAFTMADVSSGTALIWGNVADSETLKNGISFNVTRKNNDTYGQVATPTGLGYCGTAFNGTGSNWDGNTNVATGYPCLDQVGRGMGDLLTGSLPNKINSTTGTIAWPNQELEPVYIWNNSMTPHPGYGGSFYRDASEGRVVANRDYYPQESGVQTASSSPFAGTVGAGWGTLANRPTSCTMGVGYFATDQGSWNSSTSNPVGVQQNGADGLLYKCSATDTWTLYYTPYTYPHPLVAADTAPPVRSAGSPSGSQSAGTTQVTMSLTTNETATCKYGTTASTAYASIASTFNTTGGTSHSQNITGLTNGSSHNYYVRCIDAATNANTDDYAISFSVNSPSSTGSFIQAPISSGSISNSTSLAFTNIKLVFEGSTYYVIKDNVRYGVTNPGILFSYGLEFSDGIPATTIDNQIPYTENLKPGDGALVKKSGDSTIYLIFDNSKHGFTSESVFKALGYSFFNVLEVTANELDALPLGSVVADPNMAHPSGTFINQDGTIFRISGGQKYGIPNMDVYNSFNPDNNFGHVVPANDQDRLLPLGSVLDKRLVK